MRILDQDSEKSVDSVLLFLEKSEAQELIGALKTLLEDGAGSHAHCMSSDYKKEVTVCLYSHEERPDYFDPRCQKIILEDV